MGLPGVAVGAAEWLVTQLRSAKCKGRASPPGLAARPPAPLHMGKGLPLATVLAAPCPSLACSAPGGGGAFVPSRAAPAPCSLRPPPTPRAPLASCREPPPGVSRRLGVPRGSPRPETGQPASSQAPWSSRAVPLSPVPAGVLSPSEGVASRLEWAGRPPGAGSSGLGCAPAAGRRGACLASSRGLRAWAGARRHHRPTRWRLWATPGHPASWLQLAPGGREGPSPRRRRS